MGPQRFNREQRVEEVTRILEQRGGAVTRWLQSESLDFRDEDRNPNRRGTEQHLRAIGRLKDGQAWMTSQVESIIKIFGVTKHIRVARMLASRFLRARMDKLTAAAPTRARIDASLEDDMGYAPAHLVWVAKHPGLFGPEDCPLRKAAQAEYEKNVPAAGQEAINLFLLCRRDALSDKADCPNIKWLNSEINRFKLDQIKRQKEATANEQDVKEKARVLDMKAELEKMRAGA